MKQEQYPGAFITLEGPDGSGKTSNMDYIAEQFRALGYEVVITRQPGGSPTAEEIRKVLVGTKLEEKMTPIAEILLYAASRNQVIESVVKPALKAGKIVLSDRHYDSSYAYQGWGRGYLDKTVAIEKIANDDFQPNWTLFFDIPFDVALERLQSRKKEYNRLNAEDVDFRQRCFDGYKARYLEHIERMVRIDANRDPEEVRNQLRTWVNGSFLHWMIHTRLGVDSYV